MLTKGNADIQTVTHTHTHTHVESSNWLDLVSISKNINKKDIKLVMQK